MNQSGNKEDGPQSRTQIHKFSTFSPWPLEQWQTTAHHAVANLRSSKTSRGSSLNPQLYNWQNIWIQSRDPVSVRLTKEKKNRLEQVRIGKSVYCRHCYQSYRAVKRKNADIQMHAGVEYNPAAVLTWAPHYHCTEQFETKLYKVYTVQCSILLAWSTTTKQNQRNRFKKRRFSGCCKKIYGYFL